MGGSAPPLYQSSPASPRQLTASKWCVASPLSPIMEPWNSTYHECLYSDQGRADGGVFGAPPSLWAPGTRGANLFCAQKKSSTVSGKFLSAPVKLNLLCHNENISPSVPDEFWSCKGNINNNYSEAEALGARRLSMSYQTDRVFYKGRFAAAPGNSPHLWRCCCCLWF